MGTRDSRALTYKADEEDILVSNYELKRDKMKRILVVDDDPLILEAIGLTLEDAGYETELLTKNGEYVDQALKRKLPDLVVLDILLSGHDGRTICKRLKGQEATFRIPVILMSAHPNAEKTAYEAGADAFLEKPFDIDDLLTTIERFLS